MWESLNSGHMGANEETHPQGIPGATLESLPQRAANSDTAPSGLSQNNLVPLFLALPSASPSGIKSDLVCSTYGYPPALCGFDCLGWRDKGSSFKTPWRLREGPKELLIRPLCVVLLCPPFVSLLTRKSGSPRPAS